MAAQSKGKAARLFVANDGYVGIYNAATGVREKAICKGGPVFRTLFVTRTGMAIVGRPERSGVTIYGGTKMAQLQKINIPHPLALATDAKGNLFVLSAFKGKRVEVFAPGSSRPYKPTPIRTISSGVNNALNITVDAAGTLYVPNWGEARGKNVTIYAPDSSTPTRTITQGIGGPYAVALDAASNVYVSNEGTGLGETASVTVYAAGTTTLTNTITSGIAGPENLAFDGSGNLYVTNGSSTNDHGYVTVYAPKSLDLIRTIASGIDAPGRIALDSAGNLYVPNYLGSTVTVYSPDSNMPTHTFTRNVSYPRDVSIQQ
jgi:sugar lactone lactonase YvrE